MPSPVLIGLTLCGVIVVALVIALVARARRRPPPVSAGAPVCDRCGRPLPAEGGRCRFCRTTIERGRLEFVAGPNAGRTIPLDEKVVAIATDKTHKHAAVRKAYGGFEIADLGGEGGMLVNGERVGRALLSPGDVIRLGETEIVFHAVDDAGTGDGDGRDVGRSG